MRSSLLNDVCMFSCLSIIVIIIRVTKLGFSAAPIVHVNRRMGRVSEVMSRLLLVCLLFVSVPCSVLDVG